MTHAEDLIKLEDLLLRAMKNGWLYGYLEAYVEAVCMPNKRVSKKFLWRHFIEETGKENKFEQSLCHRLWKMDKKEHDAMLERFKNGLYSVWHQRLEQLTINLPLTSDPLFLSCFL